MKKHRSSPESTDLSSIRLDRFSLQSLCLAAEFSNRSNQSELQEESATKKVRAQINQASKASKAKAVEATIVLHNRKSEHQLLVIAI
jgi:hypothetical protein